MDNVHSTPIKTEEYPNLLESIKTGMDMPVETPEETIEPPPSIHHLVTNKSFLSKELGLESDTDRSQVINKFILAKLKDEGFKDTKESYSQVLKNILAGSGLGLKHDAKSIMDFIYGRFSSREMSAKDYMLFMNVLISRESKDD